MPNPSSGHPPTGYDSLDRLRQYQRGVLAPGGGSIVTPITLPNARTQQTYDLDGLGNWQKTQYEPVDGVLTTEQRQHNKLNQITRTKVDSTQTGFTYDRNGNLLNDGIRKYEYDAFNRLVNVYKDPNGTPGGSGGSGGPTLIATYTYDALGRRIRKVVSNGGESGNVPDGVTDYIYSGSRCIEERNPCGGGGSDDTPTKQYVWGIYLDDLIQQKNIAAANNFAADGVLYPLQDLLYRTTGLSDSSGVIREAYDTDAYGNTIIFRNAGTPPAQINFNDSDTQVDYPTCEFIFTGQRYDAESGIYHYKARFYVPELGRFGQCDPIGRTENTYHYAWNNPTGLLDTYGLYPYGDPCIDLGGYDNPADFRPSPSNAFYFGDQFGNPPVLDEAEAPISSYNCAGLAFRTYKHETRETVLRMLSQPEFKKQDNCSDRCDPCEVKIRYWEVIYIYKNVGKTAYPAAQTHVRFGDGNFHVVASPVSPKGEELPSKWKNAMGPVSDLCPATSSHPYNTSKPPPMDAMGLEPDSIQISVEWCFCVARNDLPGWRL